ncbi:MAG: YicC family protein [Lachnospiraceae bacterium]|nr:YicC family protein [Lachnospiraceae bacterium]
MIKSMTGFGRAEVSENGKKFTVEMKSVNHRYCEISTRISRKLNCYDSAIRQIIKKYANRGKIDINISLTDESETSSSIKYNSKMALEYAGYLRRLSEEAGLNEEVSLTLLARMPEVFTLEESEEDQEKTWELLEKAIHAACAQFAESRAVEGEHLKNDIIDKLNGLYARIELIEKRSPEMMEEYRKKLYDKISEIICDTNLTEKTIAAELIIYADKTCVDEETVRLRAHIENMKNTLGQGENVGRKLDFLAQEMNREANTILSKANDIEVSGIAIDIKTEIEKIREQIQNIE